jgi:hypothetical protein
LGKGTKFGCCCILSPAAFSCLILFSLILFLRG